MEEVYATIELSRELGGCTLVAEEVSIVCRPSWIDKYLEEIVIFGRHNDCSLIATTQRPALVHRTVTAMAERVIAFRCEETADLEYLADRGFDPDVVRNLNKLEYLEKGNPQIQRLTFIGGHNENF